jgi:TonB family protein
MPESWKQFEGQVVDGRFHLRQYLAGGEDHSVFLTEYGDRKAAIKIVAGGAPGAESRLQQWTQAAKLSHPHLLQLFAMGSSQLSAMPVVYVAMEYADEDLSQVIPQRPLTAAEAREMLGPALSALAYVHSQGFAHGHLKLSNFMAVGSSLKISSDVEPEASAADDVRALGMVLLEILTQRVDPAAADSLPAPFGEIVRNCLVGDPKSRWTVDDIAARLRTPDKQSRGSRVWTFVWAAVLALILAAVIYGPKLLNRPQEPQPGPVVQIPEPHPEIARVPEPAPAAAPPETKPAAPAATPPETKPPEVPAVKPEAPPPPVPVETRPEATVAGVVQRVLPQVPAKASRTIHGTVKVSVRAEVDASGGVVGAEIDSPGPSQYFAQLALDAARRWKFEAAAGRWMLNFEFKNTGVTATAVRATP